MEKRAIDILFDVSNSMDEAFGDGKSKYSVAKKLFLDQVVPSLTDSDFVGLRLFGYPKCEVFTAIELAQNNVANIRKAFENLPVPSGSTPLALALEISAEHLAELDVQDRRIIVLTDGQEQCGGSVEAAIKLVNSLSVKIDDPLRVFLMGIGKLDPVTTKQLSELNSLTGGKLIHIEAAGDLPATEEYVKKSIFAKKEDLPDIRLLHMKHVLEYLLEDMRSLKSGISRAQEELRDNAANVKEIKSKLTETATERSGYRSKMHALLWVVVLLQVATLFAGAMYLIPSLSLSTDSSKQLLEIVRDLKKDGIK